MKNIREVDEMYNISIKEGVSTLFVFRLFRWFLINKGSNK
jgi:hypothetical protein